MLICSKCSKKSGKPGKRLHKALRGALRERFGKKAARLVPVGCLDLCPKERIVIGLTSPQAALQLLVARPDDPPDEILARLLPPTSLP